MAVTKSSLEGSEFYRNKLEGWNKALTPFWRSAWNWECAYHPACCRLAESSVPLTDGKLKADWCSGLACADITGEVVSWALHSP